MEQAFMSQVLETLRSHQAVLQELFDTSRKLTTWLLSETVMIVCLLLWCLHLHGRIAKLEKRFEEHHRR